MFLGRQVLGIQEGSSIAVRSGRGGHCYNTHGRESKAVAKLIFSNNRYYFKNLHTIITK